MPLTAGGGGQPGPAPAGPARLAFVLHGWPGATAGGTGLYVEAVARALVGLGHAVAVVAPGPARAAGLRLEVEGGVEGGGWRGAALRVYRIDLPPPLTWEETWLRPEADALFRLFLRDFRPDIVHVHHLAGLSHGLLTAARDWGCTLAMTLHDYTVPCAAGQLVPRDGTPAPCPGPTASRCARCMGDQLQLNPLTAIPARALHRWPSVRARARGALAAREHRALAAREHGALEARGNGTRSADVRALARAEDRRRSAASALIKPDHLWAPSLDLCDRIEQMGFRRPEHCPLPLVVPIAPAPPAEPGPVRFLFASALIPTKGPEVLLRAFAAVEGGLLTMAGPAPPVDGRPGFAAALQALARDTPRVRQIGHVEVARMQALLHAHDVLVLPSTWPENSPLILREATAAGLRVVTTSTGGARELGTPGHLQLVPPGDEQALARALQDEVNVGRGRAPSARWPSPEDHARGLLARYGQPRGA